MDKTEENMFFGKKLKEFRLKYVHMGLRKFAKIIGICSSELYKIEAGHIPPPINSSSFLPDVYNALEGKKKISNLIWFELLELFRKPFVMQKMKETIGLFHATRRIQPGEEGYTSEEDDYNTSPATPDELIGIAEFINNHVREHNKKADTYNAEHGVE